MKTDENGKLCEATITGIMPHFDEILQKGIGDDWSLFVSDLMYMMYASKHYAQEMETLRRRFVVDDSSFPTIHITFSNFISVCFRVPEQYPRVGVIIAFDYRRWRRLRSIRSTVCTWIRMLCIICR